MVSTNGSGRCGPWPSRRYGWVVWLRGGEKVREFYDKPPAKLWGNLGVDQVSMCVLVDQWPIGEDEPLVRVDCRAGRLWVRDAHVRAWIGDTEVTGASEGVKALQRKHASSTFDPSTGQSTQGVHEHSMGFERDLEGEGRVQLNAHVSVDDGSVRLVLRVREGSDLVGQPARLTVDGVELGRVDIKEDSSTSGGLAGVDPRAVEALGPRGGR